MLRYVPGFILDSSASHADSGSLSGFVLFADIAGFTNVSNDLRKEGKKGAEALNQYLTHALSYPIEMVEKRGGFISHFAGDAFFAVFPDADAAHIKYIVGELTSYFTENHSCQTDIGDYPLQVRIAVSMGTVNWQVFRLPQQAEYVFSGKPFQEIITLSAQKLDVALSPSVQAAFDAVTTKLDIPKQLEFKYDEASERQYLNPKLHGINPDNEIRDAGYCFIDMSWLEKDQILPTLSLIHDKLDDYGGYLNKLDAGDKGLVALVLFGIPKAMGNTLERACRFALETIAEQPNLSIGMSCGNAYAGFVGSKTTREYTALGAAVNLASRLMQEAKKGEILTDSYLEQEMHYKYRFETASSVSLKGFATPVHCNRLIDRLPAPPQSFQAELVGRETEVEQIRQAVQQNGSRIMYISGEPGVGKSRLIIEALKPYPNRYFLFCDPSGHKHLEPIKQFLRQYFASDPLLSREQNQRSFRAKWSELAGENKELQRIESIIGNLMGFEWEGSIWNMLPPEERPEQQRKAFATLLARITESERIIIHLDDPQWLDDSDADYFRELGTAKLDGIVILAACRYREDGTVVDLEIPHWEARHLDLNRLSEAAAATLINHLLTVDSLPPETRDWIVKKADGNPLFIEQVVAYLNENDCFDSEHKLKGNLDYLSSFGIADIIGSRIDSLTESVRNTLQHACILGLEFNTRVLSEMLSRKLDDDLGEGKQARVWADIDELRYIFTHVLIKDTAYNRMLNDKLKKLHFLAAEALVKIDVNNEGANAESIAYHFDKAASLDSAALYYSRAGEYYIDSFAFARAQNCLARLFALMTEKNGESSEQAGDVIMSLGKLSIEMSDFVLAKDWYGKAELIYAKTLGTDNEKYINALTRLAFTMEELAEFDQTQERLEKALAVSYDTYGDLHEITVKVLYNLSNHYIRKGDYNKALELMLKVVETDNVLGVSKTVLGIKHINDLAVCYANLGLLSKAKELFTTAYDIMLQLKKGEDPYTARVLRNLGQIAYLEGDLQTAAEVHLRCINIIEPVLGTLHSDTADAYDSYANVISDLGQFEEAISLMKRAIDIQRRLNRPQVVAGYLHNLGNIYSEMNERANQELGIECYQESILIKKCIWKRDHPNISMSHESLGNLYYKMGELEMALKLYEESNGMLKRIFGDKHYLIAQSENRIGDVLGELGRYKEAIKHFEESLRMYEETVENDSVVLLSVLINFGSTLSSIGDQSKAITLLRRCLDIIMHTEAGRNHEYHQIVVNGLISCYELHGEPEKAAEYRAMLINSNGSN